MQNVLIPREKSYLTRSLLSNALKITGEIYELDIILTGNQQLQSLNTPHGGNNPTRYHVTQEPTHLPNHKIIIILAWQPTAYTKPQYNTLITISSFD